MGRDPEEAASTDKGFWISCYKKLLDLASTKEGEREEQATLISMPGRPLCCCPVTEGNGKLVELRRAPRSTAIAVELDDLQDTKSGSRVQDLRMLEHRRREVELLI